MIVWDTKNWSGRPEQDTYQQPEIEQHALWDVYDIRAGLQLVVQNVPPLANDWHCDFTITNNAPFGLTCVLSGTACLTLTDNHGTTHHIENSAGKYSLHHLPGAYGHAYVKAGSPLRSLAILSDATILNHLPAGTTVHLRKAVDAHNRADPLGFFLLQGEITQQMRALGEEITTCVMNGAMRRVFMEYKALELLYMQLHLLDASMAQQSGISYAEHEASAQIIARFNANLADTPKLAELTKKSGITHTRLNQIFKLLYGDTVFGVLRHKRLEYARNQLLGNRKSISEIAYECGFSSPAHFTQAFTGRFGMPPKRYRQESRHALPTIALSDG